MTAVLPQSRLEPAAEPEVEVTPAVVVLLVDDNYAKRLALKAILEPLGHRIVEADSGADALRCLLVEDFAVILLDVRMPIMDGFETAACMRQRRQSEMTPIIFITSHGSDEIAQTDRYSGGAVDFIFAPINAAELCAKVSVFANLFIRAELLAVQARQVKASADQLRQLTDVAPIGIFRTDADNRYAYTNPRWSEITGIRAQDAAGRPWDFIIDPAENAESGNERMDSAGPDNSSFRFSLHPPGSPPRVCLLSSRSIPDGDGGGISGWVGTLADVTAEAGAEAAMAEAHAAALAANQMQKNFAASASHELRTPTTSIIGYTEEALESDALSPEDRGFLQIVYRNAQRLSRLIDDLLILDEAEIGASMMHLELTPLGPLVERVNSNFSAAALRAGIDLVADYEPEPASALIDPMRLEQALTNLVSNALKFTPEGGRVKVSIRDHGETVQLSVSDTGMGIDAADIESIFGRFYRTKVAVDASIKGSGLGLAIAKRMVEAQNGEMGVTSSLGEGATFTMTLPATARTLQLA